MDNLLYPHDTTPANDYEPVTVAMNESDDIPPLSWVEYEQILGEIDEQPAWRSTADKEMDYADGNQLDMDLIKKQQELGIPPAIEDLISPTLRSLQGYEATTRTDWRVKPNGESGGQDVADALNYKLNQAERMAKADRACSKAFKSQIACGIGWVEVAKESDLFKYPYRCTPIHRNEIHWDMASIEPDLSDARWLRRQRWLRPERIALAFPQHKALIAELGVNGSLWYQRDFYDGATGTGLSNSWGGGRAPTMMENRWYNSTSKEMCLVELWYRRWIDIPVIITPDGRKVEYDSNNMRHVIAVVSGAAKIERSVVAKIRRSYWLGAHCLHDSPSPYKHKHFPYVPFFAFREDATGIPYGYVRSMKYPQDSINSGLSKLRWGMSVVRTERTKGAVDMTDAQFRREIARPNADIILNQQHMAQTGARFEVKRDYQLTDQHYQMLQDNRAAIQQVSDITAGFMGKTGTATSGRQEQMQIEQSNQSLADIMDNFRAARTQIGEMLLALIIDDFGSDTQAVVVAGDAITPERTIIVNKPERDPETGMVYLSNDIQRTLLTVVLDDVPSSVSYQGQQLNALSEVAKSLPPEYQVAILPFMVSLMDMPRKEQVIEAIKEVNQQQTPEQIQAQIDQAVQDALVKAGNDIKLRELALKERKAVSEIKEIDARSVQIGVQAAYSAMQAGAQIAQIPQIAPVADEVMKSAGYQLPNPMGQDPNYPTAASPAARNVRTPFVEGDGARLGSEQAGALQLEQLKQQAALQGVQQNTSPAMPPVPQQAPSPMKGIETPRPTDNIG